MGVSTPGFNCDEAIERQELADEENSQFQMQPSVFVDCTTIERMVKFVIFRILEFYA